VQGFELLNPAVGTTGRRNLAIEQSDEFRYHRPLCLNGAARISKVMSIQPADRK
jgi:hypothetical protein